MVVDTPVHATTVRDEIVSQLAGKNVFQQHALTSYTNEDGQVVVMADVRFTAVADRDAVKDWLLSQLQTMPAKNWILAGRIAWHRCTHDDPVVQSCTLTDYGESVR
jgi:hypothetical protein